MADPSHIEVMRRGAEVWNSWRENNRGLRPDLSGHAFNKRTLRNYDLSNCDLASADLRDVSFRRANLTDADLSGSRLHRAVFSGSRLRGTNFSRCLLYETVFANVDLGKAKNLSKVVHRGPSALDHRTLSRSRGLHRDFLRGCGLPDVVIAEALTTGTSPNRYWSCFISYSSDDEPFVRRLHAALQDAGVRCWLAIHDLPVGARIRDSIDDAIREFDKVLLVLSKGAASSRWVEQEYEAAFEEERIRGEPVLVPVRLDASVLTSDPAWIRAIRRQYNIGDFTQWEDKEAFQQSIDSLLKGLTRSRGR